MTRCGATTKPEPSIRREHDAATPVILKTSSRTVCTAGLAASAGSGGGTSVVRVGLSVPNTFGKPRESSSCRNPSKAVRVSAGSAESTAATTTERRTCDASCGYGEEATALATSHVTSSSPATLTAAPARASSSRAGRHVNVPRRRAPTTLASTCPATAQTTTDSRPTTTSSTPASGPVRASVGARRAPSTPPPRKPANDSAPTRNPCR